MSDVAIKENRFKAMFFNEEQLLRLFRGLVKELKKESGLPDDVVVHNISSGGLYLILASEEYDPVPPPQTSLVEGDI